MNIKWTTGAEQSSPSAGLFTPRRLAPSLSDSVPPVGCRHHDGMQPVAISGQSGRPQPVAHKKGSPTFFYSPPRSRASAAERQDALHAVIHDAAARADAVASTRVITVDARGPHTMDLESFAGLCAYDMLPVRRPPGFKDDRKTTSLFAVGSERGMYHVWAESRLEMDHLRLMAWDASPRYISTQFASLSWRVGKVVLEHVPDILCEWPAGDRTVIDVHDRAADGYPEDFIAKALLTGAALDSVGCAYAVATGVPRQLAVNLTVLERARDASRRIVGIAHDVCEYVRFPRTVAGVVRDAAARGVVSGDAKAAIEHLLWVRRLHTDLRRPVSSHTMLSESPITCDAAWMLSYEDLA